MCLESVALAKRWEGRLVIRKRLRKDGAWVVEPPPSKKRLSDDEASDEGECDGPALNTEFLMANTEVLFEMFDEWGWKPVKPTIEIIQKEVGGSSQLHTSSYTSFLKRSDEII